MLRASLGVPFRGGDAIGTILVGSALSAISVVAVVLWLMLLVVTPPLGLILTPILLLPTLVLRGYLLGVVKNGIANQPVAPSFITWGTLIRDGVRSTVLWALYRLPVAIVAMFTAVALGGSAALAAIDQDALSVLSTLIGMVGVLVVLCLWLLSLYLWPAARAVLAASGSFRRGANPFRVGRLALSGSYAGGWLLSVGILVGGPLVLVPVAGVGVVLGVIEPIVAAVWVLASLLFVFVLWFLLRTAAAWATGRGAAPGLGTLGAPVDRPAPLADEPAVSDKPATVSDGAATVTAHEPSPAVQVGRGVDVSTNGDDTQGVPTGSPLYPPLSLGTTQHENTTSPPATTTRTKRERERVTDDES